MQGIELLLVKPYDFVKETVKLITLTYFDISTRWCHYLLSGQQFWSPLQYQHGIALQKLDFLPCVFQNTKYFLTMTFFEHWFHPLAENIGKHCPMFCDFSIHKSLKCQLVWSSRLADLSEVLNMSSFSSNFLEEIKRCYLQWKVKMFPLSVAFWEDSKVNRPGWICIV